MRLRLLLYPGTHCPRITGWLRFSEVEHSNVAAERRKALALNDNVVQRLAAALLALDLGRPNESRQYVEGALSASKQIISDLIRGSHGEAKLGPGELADGGRD